MDVLLMVDANWYSQIQMNESLWYVPNNIGAPRKNIRYVYIVVDGRVVMRAKFVGHLKSAGSYVDINGNNCKTKYIWVLEPIQRASLDTLFQSHANGMRYI